MRHLRKEKDVTPERDLLSEGYRAPRLKGRAVTKAEGWHWGRSDGRAWGEDQ